MKHRLGTLISGGGTTMNEMIKAIQSGEVDMEIGCILSSTPDAKGVEKARKLGIPAQDIVVVNPKDFRHFATMEERREAFGKQMISVLMEHGVSVVTQNGWLPFTPPNVTQRFEGRIYNQHPGAPEDFDELYGRQVHSAVLHFMRLARRTIKTEAVAHRVTDVVDGGAVVKATAIDIDPYETVSTLQAKVLPEEHRLQIALLKEIVAGTVHNMPRASMLKSENEEVFLTEAKRLAKEDYPQG